MPHLEAICIAPSAGSPMLSLTQAEALVGLGLAGDRYARGVGFYSGRPTDPGAREVTLFEVEVLAALKIPFAPTEHRRNLTTRGVRLADLIGRRFQIGEVVLEGIRDCPPCEHLEQVTGKSVLSPLVGRAGIRARVVVGGVMHVGDSITTAVPVTA